MKRSKFRAQSACFALLLVLSLVLSACQDPAPTQPAPTDPPATETPTQKPTEAQPTEFIDLASSVKLDMTSNTFKQEVTVKTYVDGDTTHFFVPESVVEGGVLKARYLAVNTPESTGKIEEYGKKASNFTKEALKSATAILIESDDANLNVDSTGGRYLVWVWYKPEGSNEYRNLNIELLQNGLAIASNSANNRYGSTCTAAIAQARAFKLNLYSGQKDPDFFYGDAVELTLKELRTHIEDYNGVKVAFNGVITANYNNGVYVESYDEDTGVYFGMSVYYGFGLSGDGLNVLNIGNLARIVGSVQYYEAGGTYQISGLTYRAMKPDDPGNIQKLGDGYEAAFPLTDPKTFLHGQVEVEGEDGVQTFPYAQLSMNATISMENLHVDRAYTTSNEDSSSYGAMTLTCSAGGETVTVRTVVLYDQDGKMITQDAYVGKTIDVKGIVDFFSGSYQIKVLSADDINVH